MTIKLKCTDASLDSQLVAPLLSQLQYWDELSFQYNASYTLQLTNVNVSPTIIATWLKSHQYRLIYAVYVLQVIKMKSKHPHLDKAKSLVATEASCVRFSSIQGTEDTQTKSKSITVSPCESALHLKLMPANKNFFILTDLTMVHIFLKDTSC